MSKPEVRWATSGCVLLLLASTIAGAGPRAARNKTALDRYVFAPDPSYRYDVVGNTKRQGFTEYVVDMFRDHGITLHVTENERPRPGGAGISTVSAEAAAGTQSLRPHESEFERQVWERLTALGYAIDCQVGVGGYRVDLAVHESACPRASGPRRRDGVVGLAAGISPDRCWARVPRRGVSGRC